MVRFSLYLWLSSRSISELSYVDLSHVSQFPINFNHISKKYKDQLDKQDEDLR